MIRNMDLIRAIVLAIREHEAKPSASEVQTLISYNENEVFAYHIVLLTQSAMVTGVETGTRKDRYGISSLALSWSGQELADNLLSDDVWASAKKTLEDAGLQSASFEIWSQVIIARLTKLCSTAASPAMEP
ncbi:hypothetical protein Poly51_44670 [Rubripirellula tenax]|uniref:DUF2513 domain-containing protein n=1 Tax=Rubripirellula tenax TaxID=2528015 RepID=A0A5C6EKE5_9BACT|nr:DUF2513 domain-containing protein [Rubripirellula tenax]TWU48567.1 hypothetical protein Poly51_44670 [Rubripirellula tenax]